MPGETTLTRMPSGAHSWASCWHRTIKAAFAAAYAPPPARGRTPAKEPTATNAPRLAFSGSYAALASNHVGRKLVANTRSQSASESSARAPALLYPAFDTTASRPPQNACVSAISRAGTSGSAKSPVRAMASAPNALSSPTSSCRSGRIPVAHATNFAGSPRAIESRASFMHVAPPIPRLAPVTIARIVRSPSAPQKSARSSVHRRQRAPIVPMVMARRLILEAHGPFGFGSRMHRQRRFKRAQPVQRGAHWRFDAFDQSTEMTPLLRVRTGVVQCRSLDGERVAPPASLPVFPDLETGQGDRRLGAREKVCIGILAREALALAGVEIPIPGRGGSVGHGHRADGAIAEFADECTRVFDDEPAHRVRHHRLHALDLTEQVAQQIDVVDRVHEDWSTAGLPAPFDIEILVWLAPGAKHRRRHGAPE